VLTSPPTHTKPRRHFESQSAIWLEPTTLGLAEGQRTSILPKMDAMVRSTGSAQCQTPQTSALPAYPAHACFRGSALPSLRPLGAPQLRRWPQATWGLDNRNFSVNLKGGRRRGVTLVEALAPGSNGHSSNGVAHFACNTPYNLCFGCVAKVAWVLWPREGWVMPYVCKIFS
jgi:hypothetical protein